MYYQNLLYINTTLINVKLQNTNIQKYVYKIQKVQNQKSKIHNNIQNIQ